jgi:hypothetical protein
MRQKILTARDLLPKASPVPLADMIFNGKNAPKTDRNTFIRLVRRTLKSDGQDKRKNNGKERTVQTPLFLKGLRQTLAGKDGLSSRELAEDKKCGRTTIRKALKDDLQTRPKRRVRVSKLTQKHYTKRVECARKLLRKYSARKDAS